MVCGCGSCFLFYAKPTERTCDVGTGNGKISGIELSIHEGSKSIPKLYHVATFMESDLALDRS